jgi:hypothetical protein
MKAPLKTLLLLLLAGIMSNLMAQPLATAKLYGKWGFIDPKGTWVIKPKFDSVENFYKGYATFYQEERAGLIDRNGEVVLGPVYDYVGHVLDGRAEVFRGDTQQFYDVEKKMFFDKPGEQKPVVIAYGELTGEKGITFKIVKDTVVSLTDLDSVKRMTPLIKNIPVTLPATINYIRFAIIGAPGAYGVVRVPGDTILPMAFDGFGMLQDSVFRYIKNGKSGLTDTLGHLRTPPVFDDLKYFAEGLAPARVGTKCGFIAPDAKNPFPFRFEEVKYYKNGMAAARENGKWGFIDKQGNWVIPPKFENTDGNFRDPMAATDPLFREPVESPYSLIVAGLQVIAKPGK